MQAVLESLIYQPVNHLTLQDQVMTGDIKDMVAMLRNEEQVAMPVIHTFEPGKYIRTIHMPADTFVIGHVHRYRHINRVIKGRCRVMMGGEIQDIEAPCEFYSDPGVQKVLYIFEDTVWTTEHENPTDNQDVPRLEEDIAVLDDETLARKGNMDLDTLRMSVNLIAAGNPNQTLPCQ